MGSAGTTRQHRGVITQQPRTPRVCAARPPGRKWGRRGVRCKREYNHVGKGNKPNQLWVKANAGWGWYGRVNGRGGIVVVEVWPQCAEPSRVGVENWGCGNLTESRTPQSQRECMGVGCRQPKMGNGTAMFNTEEHGVIITPTEQRTNGRSTGNYENG